jgi:four helix bundle protein
MAHTYRDLVAWQRAMGLVTEVYRVTQGFPKTELYGLTAQLRRAAVSIPSNIAEGQARKSYADFQRCLRNARGSMVEVETQLLIARNLGYLEETAARTLLAQTAELGRILNALLTALKKQSDAGSDN